MKSSPSLPTTASESATRDDVAIAAIILALWMALVGLGLLVAIGTEANRISKQINSRCIPAESK